MGKGPRFQGVMYATALLFFGSLNTLTMKGQFLMESRGVSGLPERFSKPWFGTLNVFWACTVVLLFDFMSRCLASPGIPSSEEPLLGKGQAMRSYWEKVLLVTIPASIDVAATGLTCLGMIYVPVSVWQILKGAMVIFTAIFSAVFLHHRTYCHNWVGVGVCVLGVATVGSASFITPVSSRHGSTGAEASSGEDDGMLVLGISAVLLGQVFQAAQIVLEEWLLKSVQLQPLQVIGWEGAWGLLLVLLIYPVVYMLPGDDHGHLEDPYDTMAQLSNSGPLAFLAGTYTLSCAAYNVAGIRVTGVLSSVHRVLIEASRTVVVWAIALLVHYCIDSDLELGEAWTVGSFVQLAGFFLVLAGQAIYNGLLRLPGMTYPSEELGVDVFLSPAAPLSALTPV